MVWIACGLYVFISCLDSHSDGTHSLQRIHWWTGDVMLNFSKICSDEETNTSTCWMAGGRVNFKQIFIFGWTPHTRWLFQTQSGSGFPKLGLTSFWRLGSKWLDFPLSIIDPNTVHAGCRDIVTYLGQTTLCHTEKCNHTKCVSKNGIIFIPKCLIFSIDPFLTLFSAKVC